MYTSQQIAEALDLAVLKPTTCDADIQKACNIVQAENIHSLCVAPVWVSRAVELDVPVCAVIGFPHGNTTPAQKRNEALAALDDGAVELDVVINYGRLLDGDVSTVERELTAVVDVARARNLTVKAILESCCFYPQDQLFSAARLCANLGVDFVKTSTGFAQHGATPIAVETMLKAVKGTGVQVKASGGISCYADAATYLLLGCTRLGASRFQELCP